MEVGVNTPEKENVTAWIDLESPVSGTAMSPSSESPRASSPFKIPKRLQRRLVLECKTPSTAEKIEAKLRNADLRRQQYYEKLASKARSEARNPSQPALQEEDLGQRLEAKLQAAEQKRLSILAKAQKRFGRLDELRQAAKTGLELNYEEKLVKLGTKVQSRAQKAEENRLLILKAYRQRLATQRERSSLSLFRWIASENKYKECVLATIFHKGTAAEIKRLGLIEAEKKKAHAQVSRVRQAADSLYKRRELEVMMRKERLEDRLMKARKQRAEYLKHRGRRSNPVRMKRMRKQTEHLSRKLASLELERGSSGN